MSGSSTCREPLRLPSRHHANKLDPVAVVEGATWPFLAQQGLAIELDQQSPRIKPAVGGQFTEGEGAFDLPRAAVDKDADGGSVGHARNQMSF